MIGLSKIVKFDRGKDKIISFKRLGNSYHRVMGDIWRYEIEFYRFYFFGLFKKKYKSREWGYYIVIDRGEYEKELLKYLICTNPVKKSYIRLKKKLR
jgi:hypothetical protein